MIAYTLVKRVMDVSVSILAGIVLLPLFLCIAVLIRLETTGSPLFKQQRIGLYGRTFSIFKFRTMVKDASLAGNWYTTDNDPRITRMGRFLRVTSLDELPQLWNVIRGDMSLIGPRPHLPLQEPSYLPQDWAARHRVRPGITGLAQVHGRSQLSLEDQTRYDVAYAQHPTLRKDIHILLKTFAVLWYRTGVN